MYSFGAREMAKCCERSMSGSRIWAISPAAPDGKTIAAVGYLYDSERNVMVGRLKFTDLRSGRTVRQIDRNEAPFDWRAVYAAGGETLVTMSHNGTVRLYEVATGRLLHVEPKTEQHLPALALSPDATSNLLALGCEQTIRLWDFASRKEVRTIAFEGERRATGLAFSPDGAIVAAAIASGGTEIRLWRVSDGRLIGHLNRPETTELSHVAYSPDGKILGGTGRGMPPVFFDVATGSVLERFNAVRGGRPDGVFARRQNACGHGRGTDAALLGRGYGRRPPCDAPRSYGRRGCSGIRRRRQNPCFR